MDKEEIRRKMKIIKKEKDSILGELVSFTEEGWKQNGWGKYITDTIWNRKEKILILFDLYGYPIELLQQMDEKTENRKKELAKVYQEFLKEGRKIEEVLFEELMEGSFLEELIEHETLETYRKRYATRESFFQETKIVEVRIHQSGYSVIVLLPWEKNEIAIVNWEIFDGKERNCFFIWKEPRWLNEVEDEMFGKLICFADECIMPEYWGTYLNYELFGREEVIPISFNLGFYNMNLVSYLDEEETREEKQELWNVYQEFKKSAELIENTLFKELFEGNYLVELELEEEELEDYRKKYQKKEDLFSDIVIVEVRIHAYDCEVIISAPWEEGDVAIVIAEICDKEKRSGVLIAEIEAEPVEMEYEFEL